MAQRNVDRFFKFLEQTWLAQLAGLQKSLLHYLYPAGVL